MSRKKTTMLFSIVAMVALLSLGVGYAAWTDQLKATGTVHTGNLDVRWDSASGNGCSTDFNADTITITMNNAYPGLSCTVNATIKNYGSVPAKVVAVPMHQDPGLKIEWGCGDYPNQTVLGSGKSAACSGTIQVDEDPNNSNPNSTYKFATTISFTAGN